MSPQNKFYLSIVLTMLGIVILSPKNSLLRKGRSEKKIDPPKSASNEALNEKRIKENGAIIITAMRNLINDGGSQEDANKLQAEFQKQYGLKTVFDKNDKLVAKDKTGKIVAKE